MRWLKEALARAPVSEAADPAVRTRALLAAGPLLAQQGDFDQSRAVLEEGLALAQRRNDLAAAARALTYLGDRAFLASDPAESVRVLQEALARWQGLDDPFRVGTTLLFLGIAAFAQGDDAAAASFESDALDQFAAVGETRLAGNAHAQLALIARKQRDLPAAVRHARAALQLGVALQDRWLLSTGARAALAIMDQHAGPALRARLLGAADALSQATGAPPGVWEQVTAGQGVAGLRDQIERGEWGAAYREGQALPFGEVASLALTMLQDITQTQAPPEPSQPSELPQITSKSPLSEREGEVLRLVAQGLSNKAMGRQLFLSPSTVNQHLTSVFHKLGVNTHAQAVAVAAQRGLL